MGGIDLYLTGPSTIRWAIAVTTAAVDGSFCTVRIIAGASITECIGPSRAETE